jgi:16S rRNA (guanine966-N2)-methyltransferase
MSRKKNHKRDSTVRIIAGKWRGRRLKLARNDLRPTPDRVRETLFNWLTPVVEGSRGLDLFAGTGALGIEALSRGAATMVFVEQDKAVVEHLSVRLAELDCSNAVVLTADALRYLHGTPDTFDLVFLDPPFDGPALENLCTLLDSCGWLAAGARIYLETSRRNGLPPLPESWELRHQKTAGQVVYALARCKR